MELTQERVRVVVGMIIGGGLGLLFGAISGAAAAHGDSGIRSGHSAGVVFLLSFAGWTLSAGVISCLWKYAHDNRSANWIGIISAIPLGVTSVLVAQPLAELLSITELVGFIIADVIVGVVVAQAGLKHFGMMGSPSGADAGLRSE